MKQWSLFSVSFLHGVICWCVARCVCGLGISSVIRFWSDVEGMEDADQVKHSSKLSIQKSLNANRQTEGKWLGTLTTFLVLDVVRLYRCCCNSVLVRF